MTLEITPWNGNLDQPVTVDIGVVIERADETAGNPHALGVPLRRARFGRTVGTEVIDDSSDDVELDVEVLVRTVGIGCDHQFDAVVLRYLAVALGVSRRDVGVLTDKGEIQVFVVPKQLGGRLFLPAVLPPRKNEIADRRCG